MVVALVTCGLAALGLAGCDGTESWRFAVTTTVDAPDAQPGDGICEATLGLGDCTLRAAVDEANRFVPTGDDVPTVVVPAGTFTLAVAGSDDTNAGGDLDVDPVSGRLQVDGADGGFAVVGASDGAWDVHRGQLSLVDAAVTGAGGDGIRARSGATAALVRDSLHHNDGAGVTVDAGGTVIVWSTTVSGNGAAGIRNDGALQASFVTIAANTGGGISGPGSVELAASLVADQASGPDCGAPVTSLGGNLDTDASCGLGSTGDLSDAAAGLGPLDAEVLAAHPALVGSAAIDAIDPSVGPCSQPAAVIADQHGQPRPVGTGCDRGALESGVGLDLTVDTALDEPDAAVGDRVCATAAGECSLRAAIDEANVEPSPDHITLASDAPLTRAGAGEDANATGDLDVHGPVTLAGAGHVIDAAGLDRALDLTTGSVLLEDLTVRNGSVVGLVGLNATAGGGVRAAAATTLVVRRSTVEANRAQIGGGVHTQGRLTIERATLVGNETVGSGSGGGGGAGVMALGPDVVIETSTISGNTADNSGSAVWYYGVGSLTIRRSTLEANRGGGTVHANRLTIGATVIRPGFGTACAASIIASGPIVSAGYNVISDDSCGPPAVGDLIAKPYLEPLAANGGPTATHLPRAGSPALDRVPAGSVLCQPGLDQRGVARGGADACDAGAVEGVGGPIPTPLTVVVDTAADADDIAPGDGTCADGLGRCPLRAAVTETDRWPTDDSITIGTDVDPTLSIFDPPLDFNQHENRNRSGDLDIGDTVTILGDADGTTVDADGVGRVIDHGSGSLHLEGITLTGGDAGQYGTGSGLASSSGAVSLVDSAVDGNLGTFGLDATGGTVSLLRTTVQGNDRRPASSDGGGGVRVADGDLSIVDSAVLANRGAPGLQAGYAVVSIVGSQFTDNPMGAIDVGKGTLTLDGTSITGNGASASFGGGIRASGADLTMRDSTVAGNTAIYGGALMASQSHLTVERSTISDNRSTVAPLYLDHSVTAQISQSTISDNAVLSGPVISINPSAALLLTASTLAGNTGGATFSGSSTTTLVGTIVMPGAGATGCVAAIGSGGFNLVGDATCFPTAGTDLTGADALLGALGAHGGGTQTQLPGPGSPAIDAIPAGTTGLCDGTFVIDQRGAARPSGPACDIGAVEVGP